MRQGTAWNFYNPDDLSVQVDIIISYDLKGKRTKRIQLADGSIQILALRELIKMKRESARPQDIESDDYLERCRAMSHDDIVRFLDDFRSVHASARSKSRLISMKVSEDLLAAFKAKARLCNIAYQTQIKKLMIAWLKDSNV